MLDPAAPAFIARQEDYAEQSRAAAGLPGAVLDIAYGTHPRQRLDMFPAGTDSPAIFFLRGGYWKFGSKEERRFPALEWWQRDVTWIVANYRLAPEFSLPEIVDDARVALEFVTGHSRDYSIDPDRIHVVGNSAGAHIGAMLAGNSSSLKIRSLTLISGLYDLVPLLGTDARTWLRMDSGQAREYSPVNRLPRSDIPMVICCGSNETAEFKYQSAMFAEACRDNGNPVDHFESPGKDHIGIIGECGTAGTPVFCSIERLVAGD